MDNLDTKSPGPAGTNDLQAQYDALRHLVVSMLILVVVISGTLNLYLLRQWRTTSKQLAASRPQIEQLVAEYQNKSGPMMNDFIKKLSEYGRTHPDFAPILTKYKIKPVTPTNAPPPPRAATAPKK